MSHRKYEKKNIILQISKKKKKNGDVLRKLEKYYPSEIRKNNAALNWNCNNTLYKLEKIVL